MRRVWMILIVVAGVGLGLAATEYGRATATQRQTVVFNLRPARLAPDDLEIGGDLPGLPAGSTRYLTRNDLLGLPQEHYTVSDDSNFTSSVEVAGVALADLAQRLGAESKAVVAICNDKYQAYYRGAYLTAHHPVLVLDVNGRGPAEWPKDPGGNAMGPYLISHANFTPSFKILSHVEEAQIPWGVVRLEFRDENAVFSAIAARGSHASDLEVQAGFKIAQENCFRCHNMGTEGGHKAGLSWAALARFAATRPVVFGAYVRNPQAANPRAQMSGSPDYDDATISALVAYFKTFSSQEKP